MVFKLFCTFQIHWLKVVFHISGQHFNLCFFVSTKFQNTSICSSIENRVQGLYRELRIQIKQNFLLINIFDFMKQNIGYMF